MERLFDQSTLQCNSGTVYTNVDFISSISQICVSKQKLGPTQEQTRMVKLCLKYYTRLVGFVEVDEIRIEYNKIK